jgi:transcription elongation GreA/GreB family factor
MFAFLDSLASQPSPHEDPAARVSPPEAIPPSTHGIVEAAASERNRPDREALLFDLEEEDLVIEAGDTVTIYRLGDPQTAKCIKVTEGLSDLGNGFVSPGDEFGAALLGAAVGEHVVVRPSGKSPRTYIVKSIEREGA